MFLLFYSLYWSMFAGRWSMATFTDVKNGVTPVINALGEFLTSIFNNVNTPMTDLGDQLMELNSSGNPIWLHIVAFVLALITSIGIVVMAVKGVKKAFGIFFGHIR